MTDYIFKVYTDLWHPRQINCHTSSLQEAYRQMIAWYGEHNIEYLGNIFTDENAKLADNNDYTDAVIHQIMGYIADEDITNRTRNTLSNHYCSLCDEMFRIKY